jgi:hypothetical protein
MKGGGDMMGMIYYEATSMRDLADRTRLTSQASTMRSV